MCLTTYLAPICPQENLAPNVLANVNLGDAPAAGKKRVVRKAKRVARPSAAGVIGQGSQEVADAVGAVVSRPASPRPSQRRKLGDGSVALLQRSSVGGSWPEVSPPLSKVQERHSNYALRAEAASARGPSALARDAQQQESSKREVDGLAQCVEQCVALEG